MADLLNQLFPLIASLTIGLLAGALLAEDCLLLPYWRTLPAGTFYALHPTYGPLLFRFFAPLTMAAPPAALLAVAQVGLQSGGSTTRIFASIWAALLTCSLVAIYLYYFKAANDAFARQEVPPQDLPDTLARWAAWHRARVVICIAAFGLSLVALAT